MHCWKKLAKQANPKQKSLKNIHKTWKYMKTIEIINESIKILKEIKKFSNFKQINKTY